MVRRKLINLVKIANFSNTLVLGVLLLVMTFFILPEATGDIKMQCSSDLQNKAILESGLTGIYPLLAALGKEGRTIFLFVIATADFVYYLVVALFSIVFLVWSGIPLKPTNRILELWLFTSLFIFLFNCIENLAIAYLIIQYPSRCWFTEQTLLLLTIAKWTFISFSILLIIRNITLFARKNIYTFLHFLKLH